MVLPPLSQYNDLVYIEQFQSRSSFNSDEIQAYAQGKLLGESSGLPRLSNFLLLPFHEVTRITWDTESQTGRLEAIRHNRVDDWYYACHFLGDPVMPGCWGIDAVWQCLKFFAAWRGLHGCEKTLGMEDVRFFGQIRPANLAVTYTIDIVSVDSSGGETCLTAKGSVSVDKSPVYSIGSAQLATTFWEAERPRKTNPIRASLPLRRRLSYDEFTGKSSFSKSELIALSLGSLVEKPPVEIGLLPLGLMRGIDEVHKITCDPETGEGRISASQDHDGFEWFFAMSHGEKPTALTVDSIWQLLGLYLTWIKAEGTGRALGFERLEVFDTVKPGDRHIVYEIQVLRVSQPGQSGDSFVKADAQVYANGRPILNCFGARVGCHKNIRYADYPLLTSRALGGVISPNKMEIGL